jgi:type I restriction enzyme, R subunit
MAVLVKVPERIQKICADVARSLSGEGQAQRLQRMLVTFDQEAACCIRPNWTAPAG